MRLFRTHFALVLFTVALSAGALAWGPVSPRAAAAGNLPRFVSLRFDKVNMRAGPGTEYPIKWTYLRQGLPLQVLREYENWRYVRDFEGTEGWIHAGGLVRRRTVIVTGAIRLLHADPSTGGRPVARLKPGVIGRLETCEGAWCRVAVKDYSGWLRQSEVWGVRLGERLE
jgi:SH3-like domain-containing protein